MAFPAEKSAIFILGIMPRSGTNFLSDLLCLHPDCVAPEPIFEDHLLHHADLLIRYVESIRRSWRPQWGVAKELDGLLYESLGNGLLEFLSSQIGDRRLVTKTPSVRNLNSFFTLFPDACLLILVRDGRDIVESLVKSFGINAEWAMRRWADAARTISEFDRRSHPSKHRYLIVKYEDLSHHLHAELDRIFAFLELDANTYDLDAAVKLPVKGSSVLHGQGNHTVHWDPVEKPADFDPTRRWRTWDQLTHERFNWIAGHELSLFGYDPQEGVPQLIPHSIRNRLLDIRWLIGGIVRAAADGSKLLAERKKARRPPNG